MPKEQGVLRRLLVRLFPHLEEDWKSGPGRNFRAGMTRISDYFEEDVRVGEKLKEAPDRLWTLAEGVTSEKHAKAQSDYANSENVRIDAELKRRTLDAKVKHECADADKAKAEAELVALKVMDARLDLALKAKAIGVTIQFDGVGNISVGPSDQRVAFESKRPLTSLVDEGIQIEELIVPLDAPLTAIVEIAWVVGVGDLVEKGQRVCEVSGLWPSSPGSKSVVESGSRLFAPASGRVLEIYNGPPSDLKLGSVIAKLIPLELSKNPLATPPAKVL